MRNRIALAASLAFTMIALHGCTSTIRTYRVTDVQSRRDYYAVGSPTFLSGGAISFHDRDSGKMITLQSYEVEGVAGETYVVRQNAWTGRYELVEQK